MNTSVCTQEKTIARVGAAPLEKFPEDLYIPPDALAVVLETFEGPLDLLLYLIKKQNLDILNIPIALITLQYTAYIAEMQASRFELASEYLLISALLAEIKSRMLLPPPKTETTDEEADPRAELMRRLVAYERYKKAGEALDLLPRTERDYFLPHPVLPLFEQPRPLPEVTLPELVSVLREVMLRIESNAPYIIRHEPLSIRERMAHILERLSTQDFLRFPTLFPRHEGRMGIVVTLLAILELVKSACIECVQSEPFQPLYVKARSVDSAL